MDLTTERNNELARDRKPQSESTGDAAVMIAPSESIEHPLCIDRKDSWSTIGHTHPDVRTPLYRTDYDRPTKRRKRAGVFDEIRERPTEQEPGGNA